MRGEKIISRLKVIFIPCQENNYRPEFLEGKFLFFIAIFLLFLKLTTLAFLIYFPKTIFFADISRSVLIELVNKERESLGLTPLRENPQLDRAAFLKAKDMIDLDYFTHWSPEGRSPWYWFRKTGYHYKLAGENLAIGFLDSEEVHRAWKESPSHLANLLNPNYQEIGIAVLKGDFQGNETTVVVQLFGSPEPRPEIKKIEEPSFLKAEEKKEKVKVPVLAEKEKLKAPKEESLPEEIILSFQEEKVKDTFSFNFLDFLTRNYHNLVEKIIYFSLIFIIISLIINIFVRFDIQHKDLILKTFFFIALLVIFILLDKELIIQLIPHKLIIP